MDNSDHIEANAKQFRNARLGRCADSLMQLPWRRGILEAMNLTLAHIGARPGSKDEFDAGTAIYLERCSAFAHCKAEAFRTEKALLDWLERQQGGRRLWRCCWTAGKTDDIRGLCRVAG